LAAPLPTVFFQGLSSVGADNLNTFIQTAVNVAQARQVIGLSNMVLNVQGTTSPNDGGQGFFWYNSTVVATDDNGVTTIVPTGVSQGAWIRLSLSGITANSVTNADLATAPAYTLKGNNSSSAANVSDLTVAQITTLLSGTTAGTLAAGNDSRFTAIGQTVVSTATYTMSLANQATELYFTYAGAVAVSLPLLAWTPSALVVIRVATGCTVTLTPGSGMSIVFVTSGATGARTITGPALCTLSFATASVANIGAGGVS
jgi:hypothetical protein